MPLSLILAVGLIASPQQSGAPRKFEVAFVAQFYHNDAAREHWTPRVYISGLHGENRQVIPGRCGQSEVRWLDAGHLVWQVANDPEAAEDDTEMIYDLSTGRTKSFPLPPNSQTTTLYDDACSKRIEFQQADDSNAFIESPDKRNPGRFGVDEKGNWYLTARGVRRIFNFHDGERRAMLFDKGTNRIWFYDWGHISSSGTWMSLYYLNWISSKPVRVFDNAAEFDFSPHRSLYAAVENFHLPPNAKTRWPKYARAWIGNWKTGQRWWITGNNVNATSIALRPAH